MYLGLDGWLDDDIALAHPWGSTWPSSARR
jgi:hypothetical protein